MSASKLILILMSTFFTSAAFGQVEWFEPEVVAEDVKKGNRKTVRFTGITTPGAQVRVRKNRVKMYLANGKYRWALLTQRDKNQFPKTADSTGSFDFNLYLPTVPVEVPVEVKKGKKWVPYSLNFRVPEKGPANNFDALEESYTAAANRDSGYEPTVGAYDRSRDFGQVLPRVEGDTTTNIFSKSRVRFYLGLGAAWNNLIQDSRTALVADTSTSPVTGNPGFHHEKSKVTLPTWRAGAVYRMNRKWRFEGALRSTESEFEVDRYDTTIFDDGAANWFELQLSGTYYLWPLSNKWQLGLDMGLQYHGLPYYRTREGTGNYVYFDNDLYALHAGLRLESSRAQKWPWEVYARLVVPVLAGDDFELNSGFGYDLGMSVDRRLTPGVSIGAWAQVEGMLLDTAFSNQQISYQMDYTIALVSVGAKLSVGF